MKRLFYYSGYRLTVFHWIKAKFAGSYYFNPTEQGREEFRSYLRKSPQVQSRVLIDVIEEDFRDETIPHVYGSDRKALLKRLNDKYFRASKQYTYHEVQGREAYGRRDDKVLLSALTNVDMIKPWLNILDEEDIPVCGIWSLPLVSKKVLSRLDAKSGHVLLISQQVSSNVRQTYFHNGKLITSRSASLHLEDMSYGGFISDEIDQTARFLTNKRYLGFDEVLHVHIIAADDVIASINQDCTSTPLRDVNVHRLSEVEKKVDTQGISGPYGNGIFAQLCMEEKSNGGQYGDNEDFKVCLRYQLSNALKLSSVVMSFVAIVYSFYLIFEMQRMDDSVLILKQQTAEINQMYEDELRAMEPQLKETALMKSSVDMVNKLKKSKQVSPQNFYIMLSQLMADNALSLIKVHSIDWYVTGGNEGFTRGESIPIQVKDLPMRHKAEIKGRVPLSASTIRMAVDQVNEFAGMLKKNKQVEQVVVNKLPVDVRSSEKLSLETGVSGESDAQVNRDKGGFSITVVMRGGA